MSAPEISTWTAADLLRYFRGDVLLDATCFGVPADIHDGGTSAKPGPFDVCVYVGIAHSTSESVATAEEALALCRTLCRQWAPAAYDAWLAAEAIRSGLQPALFEVPS